MAYRNRGLSLRSRPPDTLRTSEAHLPGGMNYSSEREESDIVNSSGSLGSSTKQGKLGRLREQGVPRRRNRSML